MSGLVALLAANGAPVDRELLHALTASQRFRGPDGEATWHEGSVGLGHTLHRTTLEAEREQQICRLDDRLFITADARVDARQELRARLRDHGHDLGSDASDPELLLHAYDVWGERCLESLLGDFSFALWDAPRRRLVCAVDHLGVKPFYYANREGLFLGANSLECVRLHPRVRSQLDERAVGDFLLFGYYQDRDNTIYADIARIPPGHFLVVEGSGLRLQRYFCLPQPTEVNESRERDLVEHFEELLGEAVRDRLRNPRVAVFMSGGVDSSLVAMTAKRQLKKQFASPVLEAFTCVHDRLIPDNERYYTGLVGSSLGIPVDFQSLDDVELFDWVGSHIPSEPIQASPTIGPALEQMSRLARGFSTALTGWDGDALFGAATRWHWVERWRARRFRTLGREVAWFVRHERALPPMGLRTLLSSLRRRVSPRAFPTWLRQDFCARAELEQRWASLHRSPVQSRSRDASLLTFAAPTWALVFDYYDAGRLGFALDVRHPLADLRIVRFAFGLAAVPWCVGKHLLRRCLYDLPEAIRTRPKTPMQADPVVQLFRARGLGGVPAFWRGATGLEAFADTAAVQRAIAQRSLPAEQLTALLRVVGLGLWLSVRGRPIAPRPMIRDRNPIASMKELS